MQVPKWIVLAFLSICILVLSLLGLGWYTREQAIKTAVVLSQESGPEFGLMQARIDSVDAELVTPAEVDRRFKGYTPYNYRYVLLWWVTVHGYFRYQSMAFIGETDNRVVLFNSLTGQWTGEIGGLDGHQIGTVNLPMTPVVTP